MTIAVIDYNMGNIRSIRNALNVVADDVRIVSHGDELSSPDAVVVPGVGSFANGMKNLQEREFIEPLQSLVTKEETPYLGICLGLQFLVERSEERGSHDGFGWIPGEVRRIEPGEDGFSVPHMGWNATVVSSDKSVLFRGFDGKGTFYYVHSYHLDPAKTDASFVTARSWHGTQVTAAIRAENVFGVQFHPEKSQGAGLRVLENFVKFVDRGEISS